MDDKYRVVLDPLTWYRLIEESELPSKLRQRAFLHGSRVIIEVVSVEVEVFSDVHAKGVNREILRGLIGRLLQGRAPIRVVVVTNPGESQ